MATILITDDDLAIRQSLEMHYRERGHEILTAADAKEAWSRIGGDTPIDVVVSDIRMPGEDGLSLLARIKAARPTLPVIIMTAFRDLESTVAAMQGGALDYVPKPIDITDLDGAIDRALAMGHEEAKLAGDKTLILDPSQSDTLIVGHSHAMQQVFKQIALVAQSRATVLLQGESGTGKELVARAIHLASANCERPFMAVNCAALVENLLESEMFGHARGAFTGAVSTHRGKVEMVGDGTLFLDEVAELSPPMQGKLLRVLEAREYSPVGSTEVKTSEARFIAATNASLAKRVREDRFREDLYYRLKVVVITMPALRDRRICIPALVNHLLLRVNRDLRRNIKGVTHEAMECLAAHHWPGNVRELENVLMKAAVMERGPMISRDSLPEEILNREPSATAPEPSEIDAGEGPLLPLKELERQHIAHVLAHTNWHKGKACEILGISRPKLQRHIEEFGLSPD